MRSGLGWALAGLLAGVAQAADVRVEVRERGQDRPLADAAVCLGTSADPDQFGAFRSDAEGSVAFYNLPRHAHLLTVSKPGYRAVARLVDAMNVDRVILVDLPRGGGGAVCDAARTVQRGGSALAVEDFQPYRDPNPDAVRTLVLRHRPSGVASHYRVSEAADFAGAAWRDYVAEPRFTLSVGGGVKTVYFQLRRYRQVGGASMESLSPAVSAQVRLH